MPNAEVTGLDLAENGFNNRGQYNALLARDAVYTLLDQTPPHDLHSPTLTRIGLGVPHASYVAVAEQDATPIAIASVRPDPDRGDVHIIEGIFVAPQHRETQMEPLLLEDVEAYATQQRAHTLIATIPQGDPLATVFREAGYTTIQEGQGNVYQFMKALPPPQETL